MLQRPLIGRAPAHAPWARFRISHSEKDAVSVEFTTTWTTDESVRLQRRSFFDHMLAAIRGLSTKNHVHFDPRFKKWVVRGETAGRELLAKFAALGFTFCATEFHRFCNDAPGYPSMTVSETRAALAVLHAHFHQLTPHGDSQTMAVPPVTCEPFDVAPGAAGAESFASLRQPAVAATFSNVSLAAERAHAPTAELRQATSPLPLAPIAASRAALQPPAACFRAPELMVPQAPDSLGSVIAAPESHPGREFLFHSEWFGDQAPDASQTASSLVAVGIGVLDSNIGTSQTHLQAPRTVSLLGASSDLVNASDGAYSHLDSQAQEPTGSATATSVATVLPDALVASVDTVLPATVGSLNGSVPQDDPVREAVSSADQRFNSLGQRLHWPHGAELPEHGIAERHNTVASVVAVHGDRDGQQQPANGSGTTSLTVSSTPARESIALATVAAPRSRRRTALEAFGEVRDVADSPEREDERLAGSEHEAAEQAPRDLAVDVGDVLASTREVPLPALDASADVLASAREVPPPAQDAGADVLSSARECVICFDSAISTVFVPCGHLATCEDCGAKFRRKPCPICRRKVKIVQKIFSA